MSHERPAADRLDSWKEIADYLGRDVRTVRRWEKTLRLPVRRVGGDRGRSAFAFRSELDAWLRTAETGPSPPTPSTVEPAPPTVEPRRFHAGRWTAIGVTALILAVIVWQFPASLSGKPVTTVQVLPSGIVAADAGGRERWRYVFPTDQRYDPVPREPTGEVLGDSGVLAATAVTTRKSDEFVTGGMLYWLATDGTLTKTFTFDDRTGFASGTYSPPWVMTDFRVEASSRRIALVSHHFVWWPALVTVLDPVWRRQGTFLNAGWVDRLHWVSPDRLIAAGFFNPLDGGMVALLDANALDGQSPAVPGKREFTCTTCGPGAPIRYVVLPRSEVNRAGDFPFNRAILQVMGDRLVVRTVERPSTDTEASDAVYEFSPSLELLRASYSDRYWEAHRVLETQGRIDHSRERCPHRNGPRAIQVWEPQSGWTAVAVETR